MSPDTVACQFSASEKLVVVYADHTLYIWDVLDVNQASRCCMLVSHSACIWDVKNLCCDNMHDPSLVCAARGCAGGVSFSTCSADGTIRLWDLAPQQEFVGLNTEPLSSSCVASTGIFERDSLDVGLSSHGFRCMAISSDAQYLAAGDNEGNLHIYNLRTFDYTCFQDVHHSEILSLSFSASQEEHNAPEVDHGNYLLVSGGRDRVIHVYDVKRNFNLIASVDEHSAAVTSVKLDREGCKAISCSADRSLVFRDVFVSDSGCQIFRRHHQMASLGTVYDMAVDKKMEFVVTVGQDKKINTFDVASGKMVRSFKQDKDFGDPIKVIMDPSCSYLLCSYSNKSICMYDSMSGDMVMQAMGHGEVVTGVVFLPDCKHIVSVAGDGCIFVWKLPPRITSRILQRIKEKFVPLSPEELGLPATFTRVVVPAEESLPFRINPEDTQELCSQGVAPVRTPTFRFSISRLPKWAQSKLADSSNPQMNLDCSPSKDQKYAELKMVSPLTRNGGESEQMFVEVQTPSNLDACGKESSFNSSDSDSAQTSELSKLMTRKNLSQFALDKRWLSVYTVCPILNSPEVQRSIDLKMPVPSLASTSETDEVTTSCEDPGNAAVSGFTSTSSNCDILSEDNCQLSGEITNASDPPNGSQIPEQYSFSSETQAQGGIAVEESELFKQHFGSLSTASKREGCKSSVRRSYSARYVVRRDYPGLPQKLFATPLRNSGRKASDAKATGELSVPIDTEKLKEGQQIISSMQIPHNRSQLNQEDFIKCITEEEPYEREQDQKERTSEENDQQATEEIASLCREALLKLNAAADNASHMFSELESMLSREEISNRPGAKFYEGANDLLYSITEKINAVTKLAQRGNDNTSKMEVHC
ncbi:WD repeat-containing protein 62 [Linum grandiflorum]